MLEFLRTVIYKGGSFHTHWSRYDDRERRDRQDDSKQVNAARRCVVHFRGDLIDECQCNRESDIEHRSESLQSQPCAASQPSCAESSKPLGTQNRERCQLTTIVPTIPV